MTTPSRQRRKAVVKRITDRLEADPAIKPDVRGGYGARLGARILAVVQGYGEPVRGNVLTRWQRSQQAERTLEVLDDVVEGIAGAEQRMARYGEASTQTVDVELGKSGGRAATLTVQRGMTEPGVPLEPSIKRVSGTWPSDEFRAVFHEVFVGQIFDQVPWYAPAA